MLFVLYYVRITTMKTEKQDFTGQRFGKLLVLRFSHISKSEGFMWLCYCDCGRERLVSASALKRGNNKSCGKCARIKNIQGKKFGRLTVIEFSKVQKTSRGHFGRPLWICLCDCGNTCEVLAQSLLEGNTKSCGCLKIERTLPNGVAAINSLYGRYKKASKIRQIDFKINIEQFKSLIKSNCFYCGLIPSSYHKYRTQTIIYNGIDRVDNSKGYVEGNVVPCCKDCNFSKHDNSLEHFKEWIGRVYTHLFT